jgi:hypothetical protein
VVAPAAGKIVGRFVRMLRAIDCGNLSVREMLDAIDHEGESRFKAQITEELLAIDFGAATVGHGIKRDFLGFGDLIAIRGPRLNRQEQDAMPLVAQEQLKVPGETMVIQVTSRGNLANRVQKCLEERPEGVRACLAAGWRVECWGWGPYEVKIDRRKWRETRYDLRVGADGELGAEMILDGRLATAPI